MNFSVGLETFFLQKRKASFCFLLGLCSLLLCAKTGVSQNVVRCLSDQVLADQIKNNPAISDQMAWLNNYVKNFKANARLRNIGDTVRIIPVVFHVFHENGAENISDAQIKSQIDVLNIDYRRLNPDTVNLNNAYLDTFKGYGADLKIEFRLATLDTNGNCTNGIVRYYTPFTENADDAIKALSVWDPQRYLNIWVVKFIKPFGVEPGSEILGYAQFPFVTPGGTITNFSDGVIIRSDYIGNIGTSDNVSKKGRVATHEIGHWFGLFHPFQDSCFDGDEVDDTPPVASPSFGCPLHKNSCHGDAPDLPDLVPDFMDYADGSCQNIFTRGQKQRVDATIQAWRWYYSIAQNLIATGTQDSGTVTNCKPIAAFDAPVTTACEDGTIQFYDYSYNGTVTGWNWSFPGGSPATFSGKTPPLVTYATAGSYDATLIASGPGGSDTLTQKALVQVNPATAWLPGVNDDMEATNFPYEWTLASNGSANWQRTTLAAHQGNASMMVNNQGSTTGDVIDFISPHINLSFASSKNLSFYYAYTPRADANNSSGATLDKLSVQISTNCGKSWLPLYTKAGTDLNTLHGISSDPFDPPFYATLAADWKQVNIDLTTYANIPNVQFKLEFTSAAGNNIFVDDINLGTVTGVQDVEKAQATLDIYPNPASESATLRYDINSKAAVQINVFDVTGRKVLQVLNATVVPGTYDINLNEQQLNQLAKGTYMVELQTPGQLITKKLILL